MPRSIRESLESQPLSGLVLEELKALLRTRCGNIAIPAGGSLTFVTRHLPYGFGFPEVPSTHLFSYPDLSIAILNGFAAEQPRGVLALPSSLIPAGPGRPTSRRRSNCCHS